MYQNELWFGTRTSGQVCSRTMDPNGGYVWVTFLRKFCEKWRRMPKGTSRRAAGIPSKFSEKMLFQDNNYQPQIPTLLSENLIMSTKFDQKHFRRNILGGNKFGRKYFSEITFDRKILFPKKSAVCYKKREEVKFRQFN